MMETILEEAQEAVRALGGTPERVVLEVGELSGVVRESLETAFALLAPSTGLSGARLEIVARAADIRCPTCDRRGGLRDFGYAATEDAMPPFCPECGSLLEVVAGGSVVLQEVAVVQDSVEGAHRGKP